MSKIDINKRERTLWMSRALRATTKTCLNRLNWSRCAIAINEYNSRSHYCWGTKPLSCVWPCIFRSRKWRWMKKEIKNVQPFTAKAGTVRCEKSPLCLEGTELAWASQTHWDHCTLAGFNRFNRNHRQIFIRCTFYITSIWPCFFTIVTNAPRLYEPENIE